MFELLTKNLIENKRCTNCRWMDYIPRKCNYNPTFDKDFVPMSCSMEGSCAKWAEKGEALYRRF